MTAVTITSRQIISERGLHRLPSEVGLLIFDFDGVIADSETISLSSLKDALAAHGIDKELEEVRRKYLGLSADKIILDVAEERPDAELGGFRTFWHETLYARFRRDLAPIIGVTAFLDRVENQGLPFCIASSSSYERLGVALDAMNLRDRFRNVFSAELVERGKPAPDLFLHAARTMDISPDRCVVIEDSPYGVMAAQEAGMLALGFLGGSHLEAVRDSHRATLSEAGADRVIDTFDEIVLP